MFVLRGFYVIVIRGFGLYSYFIVVYDSIRLFLLLVKSEGCLFI